MLNVAYKRGTAASSTIAALSGKFVFRGAFLHGGLQSLGYWPSRDTVQTLTLQAVSDGKVVVSRHNHSVRSHLSRCRWIGPEQMVEEWIAWADDKCHERGRRFHRCSG